MLDTADGEGTPVSDAQQLEIENLAATLDATTVRAVGDFAEYMGLFTPQEQIMIATAAMQSAPIKLWYDQAVAANVIHIDSDKVAMGHAVLVQANLVTQERSDEIIANGFGLWLPNALVG